MFHPVTSFVSLVECESAHTFTFVSMSKSQFGIEVSTNYGYESFAIFSVFLDRSVHFLDVVVRISRVGEVHTHQFDALAVYHDRGGDGLHSLMYSVSIVLCTSTSCSVKYQLRVCCRFFLHP